MRNISTRAVVLGRRDLGEADKVLVLYTEKLGKISAIAKGAKRQKSKFAAHIEPGSLINLELASGKTFYIVTGAATIERYTFTSLPAMQALFLWLEIVEHVTQTDEINAELFNLVARGIAAAEHIADRPAWTDLNELELYSSIGYQLQVDTCVIGHEKLTEKNNYFSMERGGVVCDAHRGDVPDAFSVSSSTIKLLRLIQQGHWQIAQRVNVSEEIAHELHKIAVLQRHTVVEKNLKSEV